MLLKCMRCRRRTKTGASTRVLLLTLTLDLLFIKTCRSLPAEQVVFNGISTPFNFNGSHVAQSPQEHPRTPRNTFRLQDSMRRRFSHDNLKILLTDISKSPESPRAGELQDEAGGLRTPSVKSHALPIPKRCASNEFLLAQAEKKKASVESDAHEAGLVSAAVKLSLGVNVCLFVAKAFASTASGSRAVLATMLDSFVDLMSQMVIFFAEWSMQRHDPEYPVGKTRLETVGVIVSSGIMTFSAFSVLRTSIEDMIKGEHVVVMGRATYAILAAAVFSKFFLFLFCSSLKEKSASALALAHDHFNDIISNTGAIATAALASACPKMWYIDAIGGGLIALYIIVSWFDVARTHIDKIVGRSAPQEFIEQVQKITSEHHALVAFDSCRAYHFGQNYIVELEVIVPAEMTVRESHDIALHLQHKIEDLKEVERCFVHVDHCSRSDEAPEHKIERALLSKAVAAVAAADAVTST